MASIPNAINNTIFLIGLITLGVVIVKITGFLIFYTRTSSISRYKYGPSESWALITGASGGIGFGYAERLCEAGFNLVILGHLLDELVDAKNRLEQRHPGSKIKTLLINAISRDNVKLEAALWTLIEEESINITVLINNVGGLPPMERYLKFLTDYSMTELEDTVHLNAIFHAKITRLMIPVLARSGKPALIINTSSAAMDGMAYQTLYGASKAFMVSFTQSIASEMAVRKLPIDVICVVPHAVQSTGLNIPTAWNIPTSYKFAKCVLDKVGGGCRVFRAYYVHQLEKLLLDLLPEGTRQKETTRAIEEIFRKLGERMKKTL